MSTEQSKDVLQEWRESAPYWAKHARVVRSMFAPITDVLIKAAAIREGDSVLDIACGSGEPSITIGAAVGPSGSIISTDAIAGMVRTSRDAARDGGLSNIEFAQCVGEALPFASAAFDAVVCRLGVMLFTDPTAAIREILRAAKPGGRIAFAVWGEKDVNPFFHLVSSIVSRYVDSPPEDPDAPGAFRFAARGKLAGLLDHAGAVQVTEQPLQFTLEARLTPAEFWKVRTELSDTLRVKVAALTPDQVDRLSQEVEEAGRAFHESGRMRFPAEVLIVSGRRDVA